MLNLVFPDSQKNHECHLQCQIHLTRIQAFLKHAHIREIHLTNLEQHPLFQTILYSILADSFNVTLCTNGLWDASLNHWFERVSPLRLKFLILFDDLNHYTAEDWRHLEYNLMHVRSKSVSFGLIITKPDFEYKKVVDLLHQYPFEKKLKWDLPLPIAGQEHLLLKSYRIWGEHLMTFARYADQFDISLDTSCVVPKCIFSPEQFSEYKSMNLKNNVLDTCTPRAHIWIKDLSAAKCLALPPQYRIHLDELKSIYQVDWYFNRVFETCQKRIDFCGGCNKTKDTLWGCLGYSLLSEPTTPLPLGYRNAFKHQTPHLAAKIQYSNHPPHAWVNNREIQASDSLRGVLTWVDGNRSVCAIVDNLAASVGLNPMDIEKDIFYWFEYMFHVGLIRFG